MQGVPFKPLVCGAYGKCRLVFGDIAVGVGEKCLTGGDEVLKYAHRIELPVGAVLQQAAQSCVYFLDYHILMCRSLFFHGVKPVHHFGGGKCKGIVG